jgi:hypothetical protein
MFRALPHTDPVESKIRECDVHTSRFLREHGSQAVSVDLAIEGT